MINTQRYLVVTTEDDPDGHHAMVIREDMPQDLASLVDIWIAEEIDSNICTGRRQGPINISPSYYHARITTDYKTPREEDSRAVEAGFFDLAVDYAPKVLAALNQDR